MSSPVTLGAPTPPIADAGAPPTPEAWAAAFAAALPYESFLDRHATPEQRERWRAFHGRVRKGYLDLCAQRPERYLKIDASAGPDDVWGLLLAGLSSRM